VIQLLQRLKLINYCLYIGWAGDEEEVVQVDQDENHDSGQDGNNYDADTNSDSDDNNDENYCFNNNFVFKRENGGHVYLAINDILSHYDTKKKAANAVKTAKHGVSIINSLK
jgi:hypothetical protein